MEAETVCIEEGTNLRDVLEEAEEVRRTRIVLLAEKKELVMTRRFQLGDLVRSGGAGFPGEGKTEIS